MKAFYISHYGKSLFQVSLSFTGFQASLQWRLFYTMAMLVTGGDARDPGKSPGKFPGLVIATAAQATTVQGNWNN